MDTNIKYIDLLLKSNSEQQMLENANDISSSISLKTLSGLNIHNYKYTPDIAIEELGIDSSLIEQLVDDYINQIIKSCISFIEYLGELQDLKIYTNNLDYTILRELAHKNLGVAKNLRIIDLQKILEKIMTEDDLEYLTKCVECLCARGILLNPKQAYNTIRLIQVKDTF
ncbi:MAG: hypothetical protein COB42_03050 [Sulfurimonas sp.]|nr:MAG: hypothetical protein COB42_03050 [Sulfurimonas sp.]